MMIFSLSLFLLPFLLFPLSFLLLNQPHIKKKKTTKTYQKKDEIHSATKQIIGNTANYLPFRARPDWFCENCAHKNNCAAFGMSSLPEAASTPCSPAVALGILKE